ncbi:MAG: pitrilysin family protein [Pseudomonadota bacterium]
MKATSIFRITCLIFCFVWSFGAFAEFKQVRSIEGITEYQLSNGLQVLLLPDLSRETITVNITYRVGSKHENYGETGMAHILEHLLFKGSARHPNIAKELSDRGTRSNGTTWLERTNYFETFNATDENLNWALDLEADRMINANIAQKDLDSEMTVVRNEFERGENRPSRVLRQQVTSAAYAWHNYANSTIGSRSDIENVTIQRLRDFYRIYYQPDNATLIITGKIDTEKTLKLVAQYFGPIPKPNRQLPEMYTVEPLQDGEREVVVRRAAETQLAISAYHIPQGGHEDFATIELLGAIIGNGPNSRLHQALVERGLSTWVSAWPNRQRDPSLLYFDASADLGTDIYKTRDILVKVVEGIKENPITQVELERVRKKLLRQYEQDLFDTAHLGVSLSNWIAAGDWRLLFLNRDRIKTATITDVQRAAENYLKAQNRTVGLFIPIESPDRTRMPEPVSLDAELAGYTGGEPIAAGESFDPSPDVIQERTHREQIEGMKIAIIPKQTRGDRVVFKIKLRMGTEQNLFGKKETGRVTSRMLTRGIKRLDRKEIEAEFDRLKASGEIEGEANYSIATYNTTRQKLPDLIRFLFEIYTTPTFPEDEFRLEMKNSIAYLQKNTGEPGKLADQALRRHFNQNAKGHFFYSYSFEEKIALLQTLSREDLISHYQSMFSSSNAIVSIVGDVDLDETIQVLKDTFGTWNKGFEYQRPVRPYVRVAREEVKINTPDKANARFAATIGLALNSNSKEYPAARLVSYMLGGGFISSRLASRIRQKDGLSYGVWAYLSANDFDQESRFIMGAISAPENIGRVKQAFVEEMERAYQHGFDPEELAAAKKGFLDRRKVDLADDSTLAGWLSDSIEGGYDFSREADFIQHIESLTVADVNEFMRRYLIPDRFTIIKAGDFQTTPTD